MATTETPDMIEIEIDNFVSPNAANDAPSDDFIALEIDAPSALPEAPIADAMACGHTPASGMCGDTCIDVALGMSAMTDLASDLASITTQAASNAAGQTAGSLADGTMRYVGFSTADGYVTALRNGVKQATADSYKSTLRNAYHYNDAQIAALEITIIPENASSGALAGNGPLVIIPEGPNVFEARRIAAGLDPHARMAPISRGTVAMPGATVQPEVEAAPLFGHGLTVDAGLVHDDRKGTIFSVGSTDITGYSSPRQAIVDRLAEIGRTDLAPGIKTGKAQFGKACRALAGRTVGSSKLRAWGVTRADTARLHLEWPENVASRYVVGFLDGSPDLGKLGDKLLIADLVETGTTDGKTDYEIRFTGGSPELTRKVTEHFEELTGSSMLTSTDLRNWYVSKMVSEFGAVRRASLMFVLGTGTNCADAIAFTECLDHGSLMGRELAYVNQSARDSVGWNDFCSNLGRGLVREVNAMRERFELALKLAQKREVDKKTAECAAQNVQATAEDLKLASDRAMILSRAAETLMADLSRLNVRVAGFTGAIGASNTKPAQDASEALRAEYAVKCEGVDATSAMASMIELD